MQPQLQRLTICLLSWPRKCTNPLSTKLTTRQLSLSKSIPKRKIVDGNLLSPATTEIICLKEPFNHSKSCHWWFVFNQQQMANSALGPYDTTGNHHPFNLLRTSRKEPTKSAYYSLHGKRYNWNAHPMPPWAHVQLIKKIQTITHYGDHEQHMHGIVVHCLIFTGTANFCPQNRGTQDVRIRWPVSPTLPPPVIHSHPTCDNSGQRAPGDNGTAQKDKQKQAPQED